MEINTIDEAIKRCNNEITFNGVLTELNINIINRGEDVIVKYKGVVDKDNAFIQIYGTMSNNNIRFSSTLEELKSLQANIITLSEDGEITSTKFSNKAHVVYVRGKVINENSVSVQYMARSTSNENVFENNIIGVIENINLENNKVTLFIIDDYYHQTLLLECNTKCIESLVLAYKDKDMYDTSLVKLVLNILPYTNNTTPFICSDIVMYDDNISMSVINQAKLERDIYLASGES